MSKVKAIIVLDTRRSKKDDTFPVKLRITYERKQQYYPTPYDLNPEQYKKILFGERLSDRDKSIKKSIQAFENKANDIIQHLSLFSWTGFEKQYLTNRGAKDSIKQAFDNYAKSLRTEGRIGTAVGYECAITSLEKFSSNAKFVDITPDFLSSYERSMLNEGRSVTTISMYLRCLRALYNNAVADGLISKEFYPFGKRKYEIPTGNNIKKSLVLKDIGLIYHYKAEPGSMDERCRDYWLFLYLCNGINVKDLCLLKYENIKGDILEFVRAKTIRTKRKVEPIRVVVSSEIRSIIKKWGNKSRKGSDYIFDVLQKGISPERERQLIQQLTSVINDHVKKIAKELKIELDVTTYAARHSFATILKRSGVSTEFISEALGHSNLKTTQNYLGSFEDETKREAVKALTAFIK